MPIAVLNARDVVKPDDLTEPGATCWIKMTRPGFELFKTAIFDPESRIRLNSDVPEQKPGALVAMGIAGGYLDGVSVEFSDHLNTVIGEHGTGKSTLLECLRYVLDIPPKGKQALRLHQDIIKENLGKASGHIALGVVSNAQSGAKYLISRRYGEPSLVRDENGNVSNLQPRDLLPGIEIYGQNEIFELAQDEQSRLSLLDRFLPNDSEFSVRYREIQKPLNENRHKLIATLNDLDDAQAQAAQLPKLQEQLQGFESLGVQENLAKISLFAHERWLVQRIQEELTRLQDGLTNQENSLPDVSFLSDEVLEGLPGAAFLAPMGALLRRLRETFSTKTCEMKVVLALEHGNYIRYLTAWKEALEKGEAEVENALRSLPNMAGRSGQEVSTAFQTLLRDIEHAKSMQAHIETLENLQDAQKQERRNLLAELSDMRAERSNALQNATKQLNQKLDGKLKVLIQPEADRSALKTFLLSCNLEGMDEKRLSWIEEKDPLTPSSLAADIRKGKDALANDPDLTPMAADALARIQEFKLMELEELALNDRAEIQLNVATEDASSDFRPLNRLSTGQQCTAILHLLLLENTDPLVIDQPEDQLDNAFIAEHIVPALRRAKMHRQFLFATHHADIPVFGDAEWIGVFQSTGEQAVLGADQQGSIDVPSIRQHVADILEGGKAAFLRRKKTYEF